MKVMDNDRIARRIKRLLSLAEDDSNMNESHSAFLKAQEMMVKYGVDPSELTDDEEILRVLESSGTEYKRLFWYERQLAGIVADNFRCRQFIKSKRFKGKKQSMRKIKFLGAEQDVELATEMYRLVINAIDFYTHKYIKEHGRGIRSHTQSLKNDYMNGFIGGLSQKFEEQIREQEWGLVLLVPEEVNEKYDEIVTGKSLKYFIPQIESTESYQQGYQDGHAIDYKKETIDEYD